MAYPYQPYPAFPNYPLYPQPTQQSQTIQNGFVSARTIEEAYNWPIAPGNSITFKIENAPYICTKTKGFSQLEQPIFEKYRLVKEEEEIKQEESGPDFSGYALKSDLDSVMKDITRLQKEIDTLQKNATRGPEKPQNGQKKEGAGK